MIRKLLWFLSIIYTLILFNYLYVIFQSAFEPWQYIVYLFPLVLITYIVTNIIILIKKIELNMFTKIISWVAIIIVLGDIITLLWIRYKFGYEAGIAGAIFFIISGIVFFIISTIQLISNIILITKHKNKALKSSQKLERK